MVRKGEGEEAAEAKTASVLHGRISPAEMPEGLYPAVPELSGGSYSFPPSELDSTSTFVGQSARFNASGTIGRPRNSSEPAETTIPG